MNTLNVVVVVVVDDNIVAISAYNHGASTISTILNIACELSSQIWENAKISFLACDNGITEKRYKKCAKIHFKTNKQRSMIRKMISRNFGLLGEMLEKEPGCDDDDGHDNDEENAVGRWYL